MGELPSRIAQGRVAACPVDDREIARAMCLTMLHTMLVVEPSAAVGLAAALRLAAADRVENVGVVLTGGNVEPALLRRVLTEHLESAAPEVTR